MTPSIPTTREIAAACGCNQSTVSHALRGNPKVSEARRRHVLEVARRMGWRPNPLAAAYMAHLRSTRPPAYQAGLGFLHSNPDGKSIADLPTYQQRQFNGARARAEELGYSLQPLSLHEPKLTTRRPAGVLRCRNIAGIVIPGLLKPTAIFEEFDWRGSAAVAIGFTLPWPELHRVAVNTARGFEAVLRRAMDLGYRKIAVVISESYDQRVNHGVYFPFHYLRHRHARTHEIKLYSFPAPRDKERAGIRRWLEKNRPEVVLGEDIVWRTIRDMGWRVPQDTAFMTVDWSQEYAAIGGFDQCHETHGWTAVDIVVAQLQKNDRGPPLMPRWVLVNGCWRDGASIPPNAERKRATVPVNHP